MCARARGCRIKDDILRIESAAGASTVQNISWTPDGASLIVHKVLPSMGSIGVVDVFTGTCDWLRVSYNVEEAVCIDDSFFAVNSISSLLL